MTVSGPAYPCVAKSESVMAEDCICWVLLGRKVVPSFLFKNVNEFYFMFINVCMTGAGDTNISKV